MWSRCGSGRRRERCLRDEGQSKPARGLDRQASAHGHVAPLSVDDVVAGSRVAHTIPVRIVMIAMLGAIGCGGDLVKPPDGGIPDAAPDVGARKDASDETTDAGICRPVCPTTLPNQGDACGTSQECEYGDAAVTEQNAFAQCTCGHWTVYWAPPSYTTTCPGYGEGGACSDLGRRCDYQEGACKCMQSGDAGLTWTCQAQLPSCPWPRPRVGGPCAPTAQCNALFSNGGDGFCSYTCCTKSECCGGTWDFGCVSTLPPPC